MIAARMLDFWTAAFRNGSMWVLGSVVFAQSSGRRRSARPRRWSTAPSKY